MDLRIRDYLNSSKEIVDKGNRRRDFPLLSTKGEQIDPMKFCFDIALNS